MFQLGIANAVRGAIVSCRFPRPMLSAWALVVGLCPALPANAVSYAEHEVKAAYLYNFTKFIEWPDGKAALQFCLLGKNAVTAALEAFKDKTVSQHRLVLTYPDASSNLAECDLLFVGEQEERHLERILALTQGRRMLVVGDGEGYARRGMMFNFYQEGGRIRFEINYAAVRRSGLQISSKLLALGRLVE